MKIIEAYAANDACVVEEDPQTLLLEALVKTFRVCTVRAVRELYARCASSAMTSAAFSLIM